jgi:lipid-binding SYLF domain-containing protein
MNRSTSSNLFIKITLFAAFAVLGMGASVFAASAVEMREKSEIALRQLYRTNPGAQAIGEKALAVLVFPEIYKASFLFGFQRGDGVLYESGSARGYYNTTAASWGLQAGLQKFGYALFFMDQDALDYLNNSKGFELGSAPSLVVADSGYSSSVSTTTAQSGIYAFFFSQSGLMAGIDVQGTKITKYTPSK